MSERKLRAIISTSDKTGVVELARGFETLNIKMFSTGNTYKKINEAGVKVGTVSSITDFPEMMDGRLKTLHPKIHGGILAVRDNAGHMRAIEKHAIELVDIVVVNLYPFKQTISKPGVTLAQAIEQIDIGGPTLLRGAAKNYRDVIVIVDAGDYARVLKALREGDGTIPQALRYELACKVFEHTGPYDTAIAKYMREKQQEVR